MKTVELFANKLTALQLQKVKEVSESLNLNHNWLLAVMYFETSKTFNPAIKNAIGSVGLIQFTRDRAGVNYKTINGKKYLLDDLAKMTFVEQMDVVREYYTEIFRMLKIKTVNSFIDLYLATFFPTAINKPDDFIFQSSGLSASKIAQQNPIFDKNKDGIVQKFEVVQHFSNYYKQVFNEINVSSASVLSGIKNKICPHCGKVLPILIPLILFFYTVVTLSI